MATAKADPVSVAVQLGLRFIKDGPGVEKIFRCPFCGDSIKNPNKGHFYLNAREGAWKCHRCGEQGNLVTLYARRKNVNNGTAIRELGLQNEDRPKHTPRAFTELAPLEQRNQVYESLLSVLSLHPAHKKDLLRRGLNEETISRNGYKSLPRDAKLRWKITRWLTKNHSLEGVPGFFTNEGRYGFYWDFWGPAGYFIPVRTPGGFIQALKIRTDHGDPKYLWFSSHGRPNGTSPGSPPHCAGKSGQVWVTEGPLKADVAQHLMKELVGERRIVGTGGTSAWKAAIEVLQQMSASDPVIAFDADLETNPQVKAQLREFVAELKKLGFHPQKASWSRSQGKGIDDVLLKVSRSEASEIAFLIGGVPVKISRTVTTEVAVGRTAAIGAVST